MNTLVVGGGSCVWEDLEQVPPGWWDQVVVVNDVGVWWDPPIDHWASVHAEKFSGIGLRGDWVAQRRANGYPDAKRIWAPQGKLRDRRLWPECTDALDAAWSQGGSSGLFGVRVALHTGASRVLLCGVPLQRTPHFAESRNHAGKGAWSSAEAHRKPWKAHAEMLRQNVRSMSGWTRDLLGDGREWILKRQP